MEGNTLTVDALHTVPSNLRQQRRHRLLLRSVSTLLSRDVNLVFQKLLDGGGIQMEFRCVLGCSSPALFDLEIHQWRRPRHHSQSLFFLLCSQSYIALHKLGASYRIDQWLVVLCDGVMENEKDWCAEGEHGNGGSLALNSGIKVLSLCHCCGLVAGLKVVEGRR
ncbi:hypothetical protein PIB30_019075 [Stylosanthes scabra]|uniref:Uncharacterized protein n=1 Tax=Stylosanthes scabra TaxID=79078 RepID=A0ABU6T7X0_9FABA|nr:hypothetical protein [Stylosanthes scabra]